MSQYHHETHVRVRDLRLSLLLSTVPTSGLPVVMIWRIYTDNGVGTYCIRHSVEFVIPLIEDSCVLSDIDSCPFVPLHLHHPPPRPSVDKPHCGTI